jgi:cytoskeletal protein CcmA (bactofilin family)
MDKLKSFLGNQSELTGELSVKGILRLDGVVRGKIQADQVILSAMALVRGEIIAKKIIVGGVIEGSLRAAELVEITAKGRVQGEIYTPKLLVLEGGEVNGQIEMRAGKPNILDFESKSQEVSHKH